MTWHPASHPVSRARIQDVARRATAEWNSYPVQFKSDGASSTQKLPKMRLHNGGRTAVPLVAETEDGTVEHYGGGAPEAAALLGCSQGAIWDAIANGHRCRRRWWRKGTT